MKVILKTITRIGDRSFSVALGDEHGEVRAFVLRVEETHDIRVVESPDDFAAYFKRNLSHAKPIFEAILAFDRARDVTRPDEP